MAGENLNIRQFLNRIKDPLMRAVVEAIFNDLENLSNGGGGGGATKAIFVLSSSFTGDDYTPTGIYSLAGKTAMTDFAIFAGGLLIAGSDYTFDSGTGTITIPSGANDIYIQIY